jgi:hypothetical protein
MFLYHNEIRLIKTCKPCKENCDKCSSLYHCDECAPGTVHIGYGVCYGVSLPLKFQFIQDFSNEANSNGGATFEVKLSQSDDTELPEDYIDSHMKDLSIFKIDPADKVESAEYEKFTSSSLKLKVNFKDDDGGEVFDLTFSPDSTKETSAFKLEDKTFSIQIQTAPKFDEGEVASTADTGSLVGNMNKYTSGSTDYLSYLLAFLNFDPSGHIMKFSQMNKLLSRFRFLNINFGLLLTGYFEFSAKKFDPPSNKSNQWIRNHSDSFYGKFNMGNVALDLFEYKIINVIIFMTSWTLKIFATAMLKEANYHGRLTKVKCYFIFYSQKFHLIAFNLIALDLIIYGIRTVFHSENLGFTKNFISAILLCLLVIDYSQIWILGSNTQISEKQFDEMYGLDKEKNPNES